MGTWCVLVWMASEPGLAKAAAQVVDDLRSRAKQLTGASVHVALCLNQEGSSSIETAAVGRAGPFPSVTTLEDFLEDQRMAWNAAERRLLVLWGHGDDPTANPQAASLGRAVAEATTVVEIFGRHPELRLPSLLGYDACTMGLADVLVDVSAMSRLSRQDDLPLLVVSQIDEPAQGWRYLPLWEQLIEPESPTRKAVARGIVERYAADMVAAGKFFSIAAFDVSAAPTLIPLVRALSESEIGDPANPRGQKLLNRFVTAQAGGQGGFDYDLVQVATRLQPSGAGPAIAAAIAGMTLVARTDLEHSTFRGVSVVLPDDDTVDGADYLTSSFATDARWLDFWQTCVRDVDDGP